MNKQNVVYTYNGVLFSTKKEGNSDTCYNMDVSSVIMLREISHLKEDTAWYHLYEAPGVVKFLETESRMVVARVRGRVK